MKRLILCLDGTWNSPASEGERDDGSKVYKPTNVLKIARGTKASAENVPQITYYDAGVGAMNRAPDRRARLVRFVDNTLGGAYGAGFEVNIEEAYTFLVHNYEPGDQVFVFGFSRGASQARSLCHMIEWIGGILDKDDSFCITECVTAYVQSRAKQPLTTVLAKDHRRHAPRPVEIEFLGVWDTVLALGNRVTAKEGSSDPAFLFHVPEAPPANVKIGRHALAIDEARHDFQPELWKTEADSTDFQQYWFAGVHSNVGGGLVRDGLANCSLHWMLGEAKSAGLEFDDAFLAPYEAFPQGRASSKAMKFKIGDALLSPIRGSDGVRDLGEDPNATVHDTVFERLNAEPSARFPELKRPYRPKNLLAYLAKNPSYDGKLDAHVLAEVEKLR